jgi:fructuronate reductase
MDGSQKLPQRLLGTIRDRLAAGLEITRATLGVAAWMRYVAGVDERGRPIDVRDPLAPRLRTLADKADGRPAALVDNLLGVTEIFGVHLKANEAFRRVLTDLVASLIQVGAAETVRRVNRRQSDSN